MSGCDRWELRRGEEGFPHMAEDCPGIGDVIYGMGNRHLLEGPCLSVVGTRKATPYGLSVAKMAGEVAAGLGITVVSGGARGCDYAAGRAALDAGGRTIVCAGCGADMLYPSSSADLFEDARSSRGAVIALEGWGSRPRRWCFPKRNQLIACLSRSVLVAEAGMPSGTFSTATYAAELGRNVYAVPGSIFSKQSRGANRLIESGAAIIADEVALQVRIALDYGQLALQAQDATTTDAEAHDPLLEALRASPARTEDLAATLGVDALTMVRTLASYESRGLVVRMADGRYSPSEAVLLAEFDRRQGRR
jgi:DNA processing protein